MIGRMSTSPAAATPEAIRAALIVASVQISDPLRCR
jgi:hypothetical protein